MKDLIFTEKYRPKKFDEIISCPEELPNLIGEDMPHLLFIASPGTGKTTTAQVIIKTINCDFIELNASDERGIQTIREKIKNFAMTKSIKDGFKIIFLDESDALTKEAQQALRRIIEKYSSNCRFILTGNNENKFIDAIQSRCTKFYFTKPSSSLITQRLCDICSKEGINMSIEAIKKLVSTYYPDIRKMINTLQRLSKLKKEIVEGDIIDNKTSMKELWQLILKKEFIKARQLILDSNSEVGVILEELYGYIMKQEISILTKVQCVEAIAESLRWIGEVQNKNIEAENCLVKLMRLQDKK